jgi:hypothetical protein
VSRSEPAADDCRGLREEVRRLGRSLEQLEAARLSSSDAGPVLAAIPAELLAELEESRERAKNIHSNAEAAMAERQKSQATQDLSERRTIQKNISEEQTKKNVEMWIRKLGFAPEDQQKVAAAGAPYVRQREQAIQAALEQAARGSPLPPGELDRQLETMEGNFKASLPPGLDGDARGAVVAMIHSHIRVPYYLGKR